jgi:hypothetical protein
VFAATALASLIGTLIMAFVANYPFGIAPVIQVRDVTDIPDLDEEVDTKVFLPVELFGDVDTMEADNVDVVITYRPPHEEGRYLRPQLKTMYIDVISSPLERKHRY